MTAQNRAWCIVMGSIAVLANLAAQPAKIEYFLEEIKSDLPRPITELRARANGKTYTLIDKSKEVCLVIVDQRDWEGSGLTSALVQRFGGCGGNCCPADFFFVSALGEGRFKVGEDFADSWGNAAIESWKNRWSVVISCPVGERQYPRKFDDTDHEQYEITRRFIFQEGKAVMVQETLPDLGLGQLPKDLRAVMTVLTQLGVRFNKVGEEHRIEYDLDGDGKKDVIGGKLMADCRCVVWTVRFANGKESTLNDSCKRIGVFATESNGVRDLVCDQERVYRWTGTVYQ